MCWWWNSYYGDHSNVRSALRNTKKIHMAIQNKSCGMLTPGVLLLHDNACPHTVARTRSLLKHFNWELFDYPPYNPDLAPSDYHLFTYLKNWLRPHRGRESTGEYTVQSLVTISDYQRFCKSVKNYHWS
jgi:transposase